MVEQLFIHVGMPKTGSSAIQRFLSHNQSELKRQGIMYPYPEPEASNITGEFNGNITWVVQQKAAIDRFRGSNGDILRKYFPTLLNQYIDEASEKKLLLSCESLFSNFESEIISSIVDCSNKFDVVLILFVRDIYDYHISLWKHCVKKLGLCENFHSFVERVISSGQFSNSISKIIGSSLDVILVNYDFHKGNLINRFLDIISLDVDKSEFIFDFEDLTNKSISYRNACVLSAVRQLFENPRIGSILESFYKNQHDVYLDPYFVQVDNIILEACSEEIYRLNQALPITEQLRGSIRSSKSAEDEIFYSFYDFEVVLKILAEFTNEHIPRNIIKSQSLGVPVDFDDETYLLLHPDVAASGVDPKFHYKRWGVYENRRYK